MRWATVVTTDMGLIGRGCYAPFAERWEPVYYKVSCAEVDFRTKWRLYTSNRLATIV